MSKGQTGLTTSGSLVAWAGMLGLVVRPIPEHQPLRMTMWVAFLWGRGGGELGGGVCRMRRTEARTAEWYKGV